MVTTPLRLLGGPHRVERTSRIRPGTIAVPPRPSGTGRIHRPGEVLRPPAAHQPALELLVLTTDPVRLRTQVMDRLTLDGQSIALLIVELDVRLNAEDDYAAVIRFAQTRWNELEAYLFEEVRCAVADSVSAAVRMNRLVDIQQFLAEPALFARWLPATVADGLLALGPVVAARMIEAAGLGLPGEYEDTIALPAGTLR